MKKASEKANAGIVPDDDEKSTRSATHKLCVRATPYWEKNFKNRGYNIKQLMAHSLFFKL